MEYLQVFNEKREKLDEKVARSEKLNLPEGKYFMIVLVFIENEEKKFLLQKTSSNRNSCIATTGGHVTYGDDGFITAIKEVKEELGIDLEPNEIVLVDTITNMMGHTEIYYVKKNLDIKNLTLQEEEVEYVNWYTINEINDFIKKDELRKGNIKPFEKVLQYRKK